jgi:hypothetical protein
MKRQTLRSSIFVAALALSLSYVGCGGGETSANLSPARPTADASPRADATPAAAESTPSASPAESPVAPDDPEQAGGAGEDFEGTAGKIEKEGGGAPALLRAVRTASRENFERVVFEFAGARVPGYSVEYVDRPVRQCGSGEPVPVAGDAWLRVRLTPANAHTEAGAATVKERDRRLNYPNLKELKILCDFEAEVEWVLGLSAPARYRVLELKNPARLVVDVKQSVARP